MANKGLKEYTKQISQTIGDVAKVSVNVNKEDANMHILIPLIKTLGPNPMEVSLIFNYQDINKDKAFGKGCTINTFKDIRAHASSIDIYEADGSSITYYLDKNEEYYSKESPFKVSKGSIYLSGDGDYDTFTIEDQQGNYLYFDETYTWYPSSIYNKGLSTRLEGPNMDNNNGAKITFTETSNSMYSRATYTQDGTTKYYTDFSYDASQRLIGVKHYKEPKLVKHLSIVYGTNEITVKDQISKDYAKYSFENNCVTKIIEVLNDNDSNAVQTSISYEDRRTTITDNDGRKVYIYFDNNNFPLFEIDEDGNAIETEYDETTKKLIAKSSNIPTKNQLKTIVAPNISMFTKTSGITTRYATVTDPVLSGILNPVYYVSGTGSLTFDFSTKGLGSDTITAVIWGKQWSPYSSSSNVRVTLTVDENDTDVFKKTSTDGNFDMMTLGVSAIKSYSKITLTIKLTNASIEIGGIQILKKDFGSFYQYDEKGNVTESETGHGSVSNVYDEKGLQIKSIGKDSTMYDYEYDYKGNMISAKTAYGGKIENTYDTYNNITKSVASNAAGTKKLETTKTYENGRFVSSETDELGNKTSYTYDSFGKIKKITDALNHTTEYSYDAFDNLTQILSNNSVSVRYTYDTQNKLKTATLPNGTIYRFGYDSSNNLNSVTMNDVLIVSFTYDQKTGLITNQKYGSSGDSFDFVYNDKHNIEIIKCNGNNQYYFQYDQFDRLVKVLNYCGNTLSSYTYDNDGQVTKATNNGCEFEYQYDSLGEVNQRKRTLSSKTIYESYDSISRSKGFSPDNIIGYLQGNKDFLGTLFNGDAVIKNNIKSYDRKPINYKTNGETNLTYTRLGMVPCVACGLSNPIRYDPPSTPYIDNSGCIGFWFYPTSTPASKRYLFYVKAGSTRVKSYVAVYHNSSNQLVLELKDNNENIITILTSSKVQINTWNFFGFNFLYRDDGQGYNKIFSYELYLNSEIKKDHLYNRTIITSGGLYHIGYRFDGSSGYDALECKITALIIGKKCKITSKQMLEYYSITKDYIFGASYIDGNSVDFSATSVHNLSEAMLNQFEIYPLHNSVKSLKGTMPIAYDVRRVSATDKDRSFNYNNKIKRFAYVADEGRLEYKLDMSTDGTILMRAFIRENAEKQYFFELKDSEYRKLGLYRGSDGYLYIHNMNSHIKTTLSFSTGDWHTIGISFKSDITSDSTSTTNFETVRVYLDGETYSRDILNATFKTFTLSVGKKFNYVTITDNDMENSYNTYYSMLGQIEMLATRAAFCEVTTLNELSNQLKDTTKVSEYDELGMLQKVVIRKGDSDILSNTMKYKKRSTYSNFISKYIEKETIKYGSATVNRSYGIDALGNVTSISDSTFGSHTYTYNARGFLTKEDSTEYEYDNNGNIIKAGSTTFGYDSAIRDRLKTVNGKEITYGTNPLNPASWNGLKYTFEGRRLTRFTYGGGFVNFEYNDQGLRTVKKDYRGIGSKYYYDGDLLITEIAPGYRLDFLYDENNQLYGFIYNNSDKYFYIRDFMQNILGIIDTNGNLVVKYGYTAYGTNTDISGSLAGTIGAHNPFRYKGYYYDTETSMYYCKSRYYVPEWCRWLNGDGVGFLNARDINGMNICCYCSNDPILGFDPNGNWDWKKFWKVVTTTASIVAIGVGIALCATGIGGAAGGALIGAGAGSLIGGYTNEAAGGDYFAGWGGGAIAGALTGLGAGYGAASFISASSSVGFACIGDIFAGITYCFAGGFIGNMINEQLIATVEHKKIDPLSTIGKSAIAGSLNILAGFGSALSTMLAQPLEHGIMIGSQAAKVMAGAIAGVTEAAYDGISALISWILSKF